MPFANEHACRVRDPGDFQPDSFRRSQSEADGKRLDLIVGRLKGEDSTTLQAYRYPKDIWSAGAAQDHCETHDGILFEPASEEDKIRRTVPFSVGVETRAEGDVERPVITGHAAVFDELSVPLWGFREKIAKGAFARSIARGDDVRALFNHDPALLLGRTKNETLRVVEDDTGLAIRINPPDTQLARDVVTLIRRGDVDQMSFGFTTVRDEWDHSQETVVIRTLLEVDLFDVSPVTFPAYEQTDVQVRRVEAWCKAHGLDVPASPAASSLSILRARQRQAEAGG